MRSLNHNTLGIVFLIGFFVLIGLTLLALQVVADIPPVQKIKFEHGYKLEETSPQADGRFHGIARLSSAPVYYKKNGVYVSLQSGFVDSGNGTFVMADAPINVEIPKNFQGIHRITSDNKQSWHMNPVGANNSQGQLVDVGQDFDGNHQNKLVFTEAFNGVDVEINPFWGGYETTYTIKDPSVKDIHFDAEPEGNALITHGNKALDVQEDGQFAAFIPEATATDKNGYSVPVTEIDTTIGAGKLITYTINATSSMQYPITLDPLVRICSTSISGPCQQVITVDGQLTFEASVPTSWSTVHNAAAATVTRNVANDPTTDSNQMHQCATKDTTPPNNHDYLSRTIFQFDTGSVGATSFSSSSFQLVENRGITDAGAPGNKYAPSFFNSSSTNALITTDYANASDTRAADLIAYENVVADRTDSFLIYATATASFLSATTTTKIMIRCDNDFDNVDNGATNLRDSVGFRYSETAANTNSPQLIADYTAAATAAPFNDDNSSFFILLLKEIKKIFVNAMQAYIPA